MSRGLREVAVAVVATAAVVLFVLRPLPWTPGSLPRYVGPNAPLENADRNLNLWILAWTARSAVEDPGRLFDGNIYFPAENTLAGSETMLAHLPVTAPVWRATGDATSVLKAEMAWGIGGTALAVYALARFLGVLPFAAALAAAAVALEPGRIDLLGTGAGLAAQPQYLGFQYAPLALLALVAWARRSRAVVPWLGLAAALALQALACFYLGYYAILTVPLFGAWLLLRERGPAALAALAASVGAGALLVLPVALRYVAARDAGAVRSPDPELPWLGSLAGAGIAMGAAWVGPLTLALGATAVVGARRGGGDRAVRGAAWLLAAAAVLLALGPELRLGGTAIPLPHGWLAAVVPGLDMLRGPLRALSLATLALALLGAESLSRLGEGWLRPLRTAVGVAGVAVAVLWLARVPVPVERAALGADLPEVYRWLAAQPRQGGVLEVPGAISEADLGGIARESRYMIYSTTHWHDLVNGYTAYPPPWGELAKALAFRLPERHAMQTLVNLVPLRFVVVHGGMLQAAQRAEWKQGAADAGLVEVARFGDDVVYAVELQPTEDWRGAVNAAPSGQTLLGTPTAPLPEACRRALATALFPDVMRMSLAPQIIGVRLTNMSDCTWPGLAVRPEGLVVVTAIWLDLPRGRTPPRTRSRLLVDVPPKGVTDVPAIVLTPPVPGTYRLVLEVVQEGVPGVFVRSSQEIEVLSPDAPMPEDEDLLPEDDEEAAAEQPSGDELWEEPPWAEPLWEDPPWQELPWPDPFFDHLEREEEAASADTVEAAGEDPVDADGGAAGGSEPEAQPPDGDPPSRTTE